MPLDRAQKATLVAELSEVASKAQSVIGADFTGLSVAEMTELRRSARAAGVHMKVAPNTLASRALQGTDFVCMCQGLVGPLVLAFSQEDPGAAARVMSAFAKTHNKLVVKLVSVSGKLLAPDDVNALANLPTREQALSRLLAVMKAPIGRLVRTLAEPQARLARTLATIGEQKKKAA